MTVPDRVIKAVDDVLNRRGLDEYVIRRAALVGYEATLEHLRETASAHGVIETCEHLLAELRADR